MDWTQIIALVSSFLTLAVYTTLVCYFFYRLNEKSIDRIEKRFDTNEQHWRELFAYMNGRIDNIKDGTPSPTVIGKN